MEGRYRGDIGEIERVSLEIEQAPPPYISLHPPTSPLHLAPSPPSPSRRRRRSTSSSARPSSSTAGCRRSGRRSSRRLGLGWGLGIGLG